MSKAAIIFLKKRAFHSEAAQSLNFIIVSTSFLIWSSFPTLGHIIRTKFYARAKLALAFPRYIFVEQDSLLWTLETTKKSRGHDYRMQRGRNVLKLMWSGGKQKQSCNLEWCSPTTHSSNTFCLNKGIMVQFCNVNSCQFLNCIFYKDHFLASNELGNWPQILIKFLTICQKQNKTP